MSKQVNYNENLCSGAAIRDDKGRRISKLFEASHPKMTVGYAKNLIMPNDPTEQEFNFRQSGGGVIEDGVAVIDKVKGNSLVWNQQCKVASGSFSTSNLSVVASEDGVLVNGTASQASIISSVTSYPTARVAGHKYLLKGCPSGGSNGTYSFRYNSNGFGEKGTGIIVTCVAAGTSVSSDQMLETYEPVISIANGVECNNLLFRPRLIDLTQMFGAGNEPSTYEEFLSRKPKVEDEFAYNEGTIVNNKVEKVVTTGVNLWDEEWETSQNEITSKNFNPIIPGVRIYVKCPANSEIRLNWYDANKEYVSYYYTHNVESQVPANAHYFKILTYQYGTTYNHDLCINISDPAINGQYFPYEEHTLDLSWVKDIKDAEGVKLFEDGMRSAGTAFDEVGKNKAVKMIGVVDLGSLSWNRDMLSNGNWAFYNTNAIPSMKYDGSANMVSVKYQTKKLEQAASGTYEIDQIVFNKSNKQLFIVDKSIEQATDFKAAMQGVKLIYELAEPIVVEYDEKNLTYPVVAGGTEEAIASEPSTAFRADIGYGIDAVKTILDLKARVEALEAK